MKKNRKINHLPPFVDPAEKYQLGSEVQLKTTPLNEQTNISKDG